MTTSLPRLYRSLEKRSGQGELDCVVVAAVATYTAMRQPGEMHTRNLARLILPAWPRIAARTQAEIAGNLALSPELTPELKRTLASAPITIIGPDELPAAEKTRSPSAPSTPQTAPEGAIAVKAAGAEAARLALRRLALPGANLDSRTNSRALPENPRVVGDLIEHLRGLDAEDGFAALARFACIDPSWAHDMAEDRNGRVLAATLKAIGASPPDAIAVALILMPELAVDGSAYAALKSHYLDLDRQECRTRLGLLAILPPVHAAPRNRRRQAENETNGASGGRRRTFGRRSAAPAAARPAGT